MQTVYFIIARIFFLGATGLLALLAISLLVFGFWEAVEGIRTGEQARGALDAIAVLIISFAVMETANFIAEEEIMRKRELRSSQESRRSITKFITIIVIAISLEALVMVFRTSAESINLVIYPTALFTAAMFALIALGVYQWLSSRIGTEGERASEIDRDDQRAEKRSGKKAEKNV